MRDRIDREKTMTRKIDDKFIAHSTIEVFRTLLDNGHLSDPGTEFRAAGIVNRIIMRSMGESEKLYDLFNEVESPIPCSVSSEPDAEVVYEHVQDRPEPECKVDPFSRPEQPKTSVSETKLFVFLSPDEAAELACAGLETPEGKRACKAVGMAYDDYCGTVQAPIR